MHELDKGTEQKPAHGYLCKCGERFRDFRKFHKHLKEASWERVFG